LTEEISCTFENSDTKALEFDKKEQQQQQKRTERERINKLISGYNKM